MTQTLPPMPNAPLGGRLAFEAEGFTYDRRKYPYAQVRHVEFETRRHVVRGADGQQRVRHESRLRVKIAPAAGRRGRWLVIRLIGWFRAVQRTFDASAHEAMVRAAETMMARTFDARMDGYMADFARQNYLTWGHYQLSPNGDLYRRFAYCMNLRDPDVNCLLFPDRLVCVRKPLQWWWRLLWHFVKDGEVIHLTRDRDCFLYFMRRQVGLWWNTETLRLWHGKAADGVTEEAKAPPPPPAGREAGGQHAPPPPPPAPRPMATSVQHLATLGLGKDAKWEEVRRTYRMLARKFHPDLLRGRGAGPKELQEAEERLKSINQAYGWLEDFYRLKPKD